MPIDIIDIRLYNYCNLMLKGALILRNINVKRMAFAGMMAAVAVVIMCLGCIVPFATYICPVLCSLIGGVVFLTCGKRLAWTWYISVGLLSMMLTPDREAGIVYLFLGVFPNIKHTLDKTKLKLIFKLLYFNISAVSFYWFGAYIMGITEILQDFNGIGIAGVILLLLLSNITFLLLDSLLDRINKLKIDITK